MADLSPPLMIPGEWEPRHAAGTIHADTSRPPLEAGLAAPPLITSATQKKLTRPDWIWVSLVVGALLIATLVAMFGASVAKH